MSLSRKDILSMTMSDRIDAYNKLNPEKPVKKFENLETAIRRILESQDAAKDKPPVIGGTPRALVTKKNVEPTIESKPNIEPKKKSPKIIATIREICKIKGGLTKDEILKKITPIFPLNHPDSLATTITLHARNNKEYPKFIWEVLKTRGEIPRYQFKGEI